MIPERKKEGDEAGRQGAPPSGGAIAASHLAGVPPVPLVVPASALPPGNSSPGKQGAGDTCLEGWHRHLSDGPRASRRRRNRASRGPRRVPGRAGIWPPAPRHARGFPGGGQSVRVPEEAPAARQLLEDLRRRLASAFQRAAAREQQSRACFEGALGRLSAELLEMHFQNRQLVRTVLDLNMKMQQLKKEYELEIASKSQSSEDNSLNRE
nr:alanine and arginine-rich domain-containing protein [Equus caballus]